VRQQIHRNEKRRQKEIVMNTAALGNYCLALAVLCSCGAMLASICAGRFRSSAALNSTRWLMHSVTVFLTLASAALLHAILNNEFALGYVVRFSDRALPFEYKLSAFWAGHEGSLLLWAWLMAVGGSISVVAGRKDNPRSQGPSIGIMAAICGMFVAVMLFASDPITGDFTSNPFALGDVIPQDGTGMNPMLQHWAMVTHPPTLFLGYAGFAIPFALALGALIGGRKDNLWVAPIRRWVVGSWLFLTIGIVLGSWWAYVELGWGGYWKWDPVENASLLPWLTGTALMHSLILHERRGTLKVWNAFLIPVTFLLCIFGTYLTRSGVIASVHAFPQSEVGKFFLIMLVIGIVVSLGVTAWRFRLLKSERKFDKIVSYEGAFIGGNVLLTVIMLTTLVGTIFPVLGKLFVKDSVTLGEEFYNTIVLPMALLLAAIMAFGPLLRYANKPGAWAKRLVAPGIAAVVAGVAAGFWSAHVMDKGLVSSASVWMILSAAVTAFTVVCITEDFIRTLGVSGRSAIRRWSGQLVHLGMVMIVIGVAGSGIFSIEKPLLLQSGQVQQVGKYKVRMIGLEMTQRANYLAQTARIGISAPSGDEFILAPERREYTNASQINKEVDLRTGLREDVYVIFDDAIAGHQDMVRVRVLINPLLLWIWIGGIAMSVGSLVCLVTPGRRRSKNAIPAADTFGVSSAACQEAPQ
jgi:cytochrome c-type biogenesis protein CcmF